ncbi:MAG TPA: hypothetical protein ENG73_07925 [Desulfobacterales bacterium]|nr:hypothetical protein [Desulfobacterales bacterium]
MGWTSCWLLKKHHTQTEKEKAVKFLRTRPLSLREAAWVLKVSSSVLSDWNQSFDKEAKITVEMVKVIVQAAEHLRSRGRRLRLKGFTEQLRKDYDIHLSKRKVREVLIANVLFAVRTRKRRPRFYQSLRKEIPNGLLSLDGSELTVWLDKEPYKFNVELSVDVKTFAHTAFSVGDSQTSDEVIKVLEAHRKDWGDLLGILCDHGSGNLSGNTLSYLQTHGIELISAGPYNPKGNGTDEGAFSQMKQALGGIRLDLSSPRSLARSVLEKLISLYITMRNRIPVKGAILTPEGGMKVKVSKEQWDLERQHLKDYKRSKLEYEKEAISDAEEVFTKVVNREPGKKTLSCFFGILKRIQQERDDEAYRRYCHERYNEQVMKQLKRQEQEQQSHHSVEGIVEMLAKDVKTTFHFVKELAISKARQWTKELMKSYHYPGALKNHFAKAWRS